MQIIKTSVIENIKHNFEELFPAEKKTAQYILDHLEEVTLLNTFLISHSLLKKLMQVKLPLSEWQNI